MSDPQSSSSRTVFVGNIPFDATESQIREILNTVGPLQGLRLVHDAKTGKPKGYGFAEYLDPHTAASAIRNLNNHDLNGRSLRVDSADDDKPLDQRCKRQRARTAVRGVHLLLPTDSWPVLGVARVCVERARRRRQHP